MNVTEKLMNELKENKKIRYKKLKKHFYKECKRRDIQKYGGILNEETLSNIDVESSVSIKSFKDSRDDNEYKVSYNV